MDFKHIICTMFGHKPEWTSKYQLVYYDPDPVHDLRCERCGCCLDQITYNKVGN